MDIKTRMKYVINLFNRYLPLGFKSKYLTLKGEVVSQKIGNYKIYAHSYGALYLLKKEIFEKREYQFLSKNNQPKIIDCGANIGMSVLFFKMLYPNSSILAFEPNPQAFEMLVKNIEENNLRNVTTINAALSNKNGLISFYQSNEPDSLRGSTNSVRGGKNKYQVKTIKLSSYIDDFDIDLIKMDVEGSEWEVLDDLKEADKLRKCKQYLIEYHHNIMNEPSRLSTFLSSFEKMGYTYKIRASFKEDRRFQDIFLNVNR